MVKQCHGTHQEAQVDEAAPWGKLSRKWKRFVPSWRLANQFGLTRGSNGGTLWLCFFTTPNYVLPYYRQKRPYFSKSWKSKLKQRRKDYLKKEPFFPRPLGLFLTPDYILQNSSWLWSNNSLLGCPNIFIFKKCAHGPKMKPRQVLGKYFEVYGQRSPITPEAGKKKAPFSCVLIFYIGSRTYY